MFHFIAKLFVKTHDKGLFFDLGVRRIHKKVDSKIVGELTRYGKYSIWV